jgi:hypothetical protein
MPCHLPAAMAAASTPGHALAGLPPKIGQLTDVSGNPGTGARTWWRCCGAISGDGRDDRQPHQRSPWAGASVHTVRALGTHYLTSPSLRLPPGYRLWPGRLPGGPDHPDWPLPPRR